MCSGYYDYEKGYDPSFPGIETFKGKIIHPQKWDASISYDNQKVIIIGSGATAVTLAPEMSKRAEKVYMLQRTPTYVINLPAQDAVANFFRKILPANAAYQIVRWKNILMAIIFYSASRKWPRATRNYFLKADFVQHLAQKRHSAPRNLLIGIAYLEFHPQIYLSLRIRNPIA